MWGRLTDALPVLDQLTGGGGDPLGEGAFSTRTRELSSRTADADQVTTSVCPYCAVGCSQRVYVRDGRITNIEGNPDSPINRGRLCPKGSATFQLVTGTHRLDTVLHRRPGATEWEPIALDDAMDRVAALIAETRDRTWEESDADGRPLRRSQGIAFMGGSTLDNEECYLLAKFWAQLGVLQVENQARI
ncbi:MAG: dehydrogenase [Candidatus Microthrix sp.]|nr:dehydrogenase [Candidatus Microthrix sp.]MBK7164397.1 dehydrogenase [Candidatus Microthrix sp.]